MYELEITQIRPYVYSDGTKSTTKEVLRLYFNTMEMLVQTMQLVMKGSKVETTYEIRELEEGEIEDEK